MHSLDWTPAGGLGIAVGGQLAADGVVEYEDSGCAGSVVVRFVSWVTNVGRAGKPRHLHVLE